MQQDCEEDCDNKNHDCNIIHNRVEHSSEEDRPFHYVTHISSILGMQGDQYCEWLQQNAEEINQYVKEVAFKGDN